MPYNENPRIAMVLEAALIEALPDGLNLADVSDDLDGGTLVDDTGAELEVTESGSLKSREFMTNDRGVWVKLTDGSEFTITIHRYR